jgi:hypothetical protein
MRFWLKVIYIDFESGLSAMQISYFLVWKCLRLNLHASVVEDLAAIRFIIPKRDIRRKR